jgi:hypothetical protein
MCRRCGLTAPVFYYQGRVHAGLGSTESVQQYERFVSIKKGGDEQA